MAGGSHDYGKKGIFFGKAVIGFLVFAMLCIYLYNQNTAFLDGQAQGMF